MKISVHGLSKSFSSVTVLETVDLEVRGGEVLGLVGANGAGKTTFLKLVAGILKPDEGKIWVADIRVDENPRAARERIGYLPDEPYLLEHLTAFEVLWLSASQRVKSRKRLKTIVMDMLQLWDLGARANDLIRTFSHGMRQKVLLSSVLLARSPVLLLDEPFNGLDVYSAGILRTLIRRLAEDGRTVVVSSHALGFVEEICSRIVILSQGRFAFDSSGGPIHSGSLERLVMDSAPKLNPDLRANEIYALLQTVE